MALLQASNCAARSRAQLLELLIPVLRSPTPAPRYPPLARPGSNMPKPYDCAYFSHMAVQSHQLSRGSRPKHIPILVTMDTFQPELCHEGIEKATVTRRRSCRARFLWQLTQERNMMNMMMMLMMMMIIIIIMMTMKMTMRMTMAMTMIMTMMMMTTTISKHPGRPAPRTTPHQRLAYFCSLPRKRQQDNTLTLCRQGCGQRLPSASARARQPPRMLRGEERDSVHSPPRQLGSQAVKTAGKGRQRQTPQESSTA